MELKSKRLLKKNIKTLLDSDIIDSVKYSILSDMYGECVEVASKLMFEEFDSLLSLALEYVDIVKRAMNFISPAAHSAKGCDLPEKDWEDR